MMNFVLFLFSACAVLINVLGFKVLGILQNFGKSHYAIGYSIVDALHEAGHELTLITPFPSHEPKENYREVSMADLIEKVEAEQKNSPSSFSFGKIPISIMFFTLYHFGALGVEMVMQNEGVQKLIESEEKFDVCVTEIFNVEAIMGLADHFQCEIISYTAFGAVRWIDEMTGNQSPTSYVPHPFASNTEIMNFSQRLYNTALSLFEYLAFNLYHIPKQRSLYNKYFPNAKKSFDEMFKNSGIIFLNTHVSISSARPYLPSVIEIGGIHVKKAKELPENIQKFLDSAEDGAILFTMGSFIKCQDFPENIRDSLVKVFGKLKQKVIWKYENETLPNKPENVMISSWVPQRDILAHKNIKLFITHGVLLGTTEAVVEGIPVLGFPVYGDQKMNMAKASARGYGVSIPFEEITEENLLKSLNELLNNSKYNNNAKEISARFNDRPMTPQETVVYWTEYVVRNKGAPHLRAESRNLDFIQSNLIDVYAVLLVIAVLILFVDYLILKFIFKKIFNKNVKKVKKN